jgi:hypothetical protein
MINEKITLSTLGTLTTLSTNICLINKFLTNEKQKFNFHS